MEKKYILAIDQGTTSTRAILFNKNGTAAGQSQKPHKQIYPQPGSVSHDANEIFENTLSVTRDAVKTADASPDEIAAIGITNQRETVVLWDKQTGQPICDAIVWQCRRTAPICAQMEQDGMGIAVRNKTGLLIDPYFSGTKIKWILENIPGAKDKMKNGELLAGTIDSFLIWKLTGGKNHVTDYTNASRTMLFNINKLEWDDELLNYFEIDKNILPEVVPSVGIAGITDPSVAGMEIPIAGIAGDQHAALFGQACFNIGDVKNTYGTGCFILKNIGKNPLITSGKLLTTLAWFMDGKPTYALEGSVFSVGAAVEWLINEVKLVSSTKEINALCAATPDTGGVYFVPALTGLGAPYWDMYARGTLCGLSLASGKGQIVRAVMEAAAFRTRDVAGHMAEASGIPIPVLKVDGGVSQSDFTMQFQSDLLGKPVERPRFIETTAQGVFYMAGLGAGLFENVDEIKENHEIEKIFEPKVKKEDMDERYRLWQKAVARSRDWAEQ